MKALCRFALVAVCGLSLVAVEARGQVPAQPANDPAKTMKETVDYVAKTFPKETAAEGLEPVTKKIEQFITTYGDDGVQAVRKVGPKAIGVAAEAGEHGAAWVKTMGLYGDDAAVVLVKHKPIAESLVSNGGEPAVRALKAIDPPYARLISRMAADPASSALTHNPKVLDVVAKHGDEAVRYIWRNKGKLSVAPVLATFVANPKPYLDGLSDLSQATVAPGAGPGTEAVRSSWSFMIWIVALAVVGLVGWQGYVRYKIYQAQQQTGPIARK